MAGRRFYLYENAMGRYYVHVFSSPTHAAAWVKVRAGSNPGRFKTEARGRAGFRQYDHRGEIDFAVDDEMMRIEDAAEESAAKREEAEALALSLSPDIDSAF